MATTLPTVADIVGVDREVEAKTLVAAQLTEIETVDPLMAEIVRRRVINDQPLAQVAADLNKTPTEVSDIFLRWAHTTMEAIRRVQVERATA